MLEYAVSVWSPCYNYAIDKVESVQRKFTKRFRGCNNMDYSARLDHLQLQSLERRHLIADLVLTYRIIFGLTDHNMSDYFTLQSLSGCSSAATRGNPYNFLSTIVLMCENIFFSERIIRVWNSLPPSIVSFKSLLSFRNSLGNVNLGI